MAAGADLVMSANWGPDLRLLLQQGAQLGWKVKLAGFFLNDPTLTQAVKDAAVGHVTTGVHMITVDTPENNALIEKWRAKFPEAPIFYRVPDLITGRGVNAWSWLFEVIRRAGSLDAETLIKTWERSSFRAPWGDVRMRGCDHQMLSPCFVAEVMQPAAIPEAIRYYGNDFPYIGTATTIPAEVIVTPAVEGGNKRCSA
jgi:branched-chain amino acid transport system substrate-binding protein